MLRAIGTGPIVVPRRDGTDPESGAGAGTGVRRRGGPGQPADAGRLSSMGTAPAVRTLRLREVAAGGGAAAASWSLAAHLGLLGTATGTFLVSVVSAALMALAVDSLVGARRLLLRWVRSTSATRRHRSRVPAARRVPR